MEDKEENETLMIEKKLKGRKGTIGEERKTEEVIPSR